MFQKVWIILLSMQKMVYESDLSDVEWSFLKPLVPEPKPGGRPASWSRRAVLNGIFYLLGAAARGALRTIMS